MAALSKLDLFTHEQNRVAAYQWAVISGFKVTFDKYFSGSSYNHYLSTGLVQIVLNSLHMTLNNHQSSKTYSVDQFLVYASWFFYHNYKTMHLQLWNR